ncbi:N-acetylmuramoyl-L-alanine amidase [Wenxinia marina]|uniref:N-acetylmuramoyl-L-alanine amidase n=1 Tax=Wenxinia marina DSM 24838 TaxID=1123501 RepID=A0A0D0QBL6_9RHOB|nr:N-acetylmuramoyl-L-alanine amidase [Wenxinia marina]KIQ68343.1 Negative regulator of beta-lactamase expression [Wenxinia marina DSM 24838]GGL72926.1 N-acetylmuramoyl-L-alanine amidase [Wenxinia marina]
MRPSLVVIHYTAMATCDAALERLCDPAAEVSAHWLIGEGGRTWALVDEAERAWHAGAGHWAGTADVNSHSIGIELANDGRTPYPEAQMLALETLLAGIAARWDVRPEGVIGHSDMAPVRKADPGPLFDWRRLARADLSVWPEGAEGEADPAAFREALAAFGYDPALPIETLLAAFRLRFAPHATGPLTGRETAMARDLALRWPARRLTTPPEVQSARD